MCAGVQRAIRSVEMALQQFGAPVYVRHEIVHNQYVTCEFAKKGVVFIDDLDEILDTSRPVIFSAHGVSRSVTREAEKRGLTVIDATCPLVTRVHNSVRGYFERGYHVVFIGHAGHPEVVGTMGQLPEGAIILIETAEDVCKLDIPPSSPVACACQTTLSVDEAAVIIDALKSRFPAIVLSERSDICYATTNRQHAVKVIASSVEAFIVVGASNSSNSQRLKETAEREGCLSFLVQYPEELNWDLLSTLGALSTLRIGLTAGASTPEVLVENMISALSDVYDITVETVSTVKENIAFGLPVLLRN